MESTINSIKSYGPEAQIRTSAYETCTYQSTDNADSIKDITKDKDRCKAAISQINQKSGEAQEKQLLNENTISIRNIVCESLSDLNNLLKTGQSGLPLMTKYIEEPTFQNWFIMSLEGRGGYGVVFRAWN